MEKTQKAEKLKTDFTIKSVHKALDIVDYLSKIPSDASVKELSDALQINKSTISKMLSTLELHGYVRQNSQTLRYQIGFKPMLLAQKAIEKIEVQSIAEPYLLRLREETKETVNFAICSEDSLTYVATYEGYYPVRLSSTAGMQASLSNSAVGKAYLAFCEDPKRSKFLQLATNNMANSEKKEFLENLDNIRIRGFSTNKDELTKGVSGVGAPVFDFSGNLVAAVAVAGLSARMSETVLHAFGLKLMGTCKAISKELGYDPKP